MALIKDLYDKYEEAHANERTLRMWELQNEKVKWAFKKEHIEIEELRTLLTK